MPTANKARGEMELEVDGRKYVLRPSFETLSKIEAAIDKGAIDLIERIRSLTISSKDIVTVIWMAAKGSGNRDVPSLLEFGEKIRRGMGLPVAGFVALGFLSASISNDEQLEEEVAKLKEQEDESDADPSAPSEEQEDQGTEDPNPSE